MDAAKVFDGPGRARPKTPTDSRAPGAQGCAEGADEGWPFSWLLLFGHAKRSDSGGPKDRPKALDPAFARRRRNATNSKSRAVQASDQDPTFCPRAVWRGEDHPANAKRAGSAVRQGAWHRQPLPTGIATGLFDHPTTRGAIGRRRDDPTVRPRTPIPRRNKSRSRAGFGYDGAVWSKPVAAASHKPAQRSRPVRIPFQYHGAASAASGGPP
jgi:hypothetical protein